MQEARVLVVVEDKGLLASLRGALGDAYVVTACDSPKAALRMVESGTDFDVVVCDLLMLEMSGRELHERLSRIDPVLARNTLVLGGSPLSIEDEEFLEGGRVRVLPRRFGFEHLRTELHALAMRASLYRLAAAGR